MSVTLSGCASATELLCGTCPTAHRTERSTTHPQGEVRAAPYSSCGLPGLDSGDGQDLPAVVAAGTCVAHSKHLHPLIAQQALTKQPSKQKSVDPTRLREKRKGKEGGKEETVESEISRAVFTLIFAPGVS